MRQVMRDRSFAHSGGWLNLDVVRPRRAESFLAITLAAACPASRKIFHAVIATNDLGSATLQSFLSSQSEQERAARNLTLDLLNVSHTPTSIQVCGGTAGTCPGATYWPSARKLTTRTGPIPINLDHQLSPSVTYDLPFRKGQAYAGN